MENKKICIISTDNKFEAVYYEGNNRPLNCVLIVPDRPGRSNGYLLINTGIEVYWRDYERETGVLEVIHNGEVLLKKSSVYRPQLVIDVLNRFNTISKSELELLILEIQEKEKTALEISIEKLKQEKASLEEQINIYKTVQTKKEEIKELLSKLE